MLPSDAQPIQSALVFYANPPLSVGGAFVGCTVREEVRQRGRTIQIIAMGYAVRNCEEFAN